MFSFIDQFFFQLKRFYGAHKSILWLLLLTLVVQATTVMVTQDTTNTLENFKNSSFWSKPLLKLNSGSGLQKLSFSDNQNTFLSDINKSDGLSQTTPTPYAKITPSDLNSRTSPTPTLVPIQKPTVIPTPIPTSVPTLIPTNTPTPTLVPTRIPTNTPTPTVLPTQVPTNTPTPTPTPTPVPTSPPDQVSSRTVSLYLTSTNAYTPYASASVDVQVFEHASGYWDFIISGYVTELIPNREYQFWLCGNGCSSHSGAKFFTDNQGNATLSQIIINHNQANDPLNSSRIYQTSTSGSVGNDFTACLMETLYSSPCLRATSYF